MRINQLLLAALIVTTGLTMISQATAGVDNVRFEDEKLYVDGKPFFFWGFIWRSGANSFEEMKKFHFNACLGKLSQAQFDEAAEVGVYLMAPHSSTTKSPPEWVVHHPAMIAYFTGDDVAGQKGREKQLKIVEQIRKVDQSHPTTADLNGRSIESDILFVDILDIYAPYAYPLPRYGFRWYFEDFLDKLRYGVGRKYMWTAMQSASIYGAHGRMGFTWKDMQQYPAPGQFRLLCWGSIAHGLRGFMFWKDRGLLPPDMDNGDRTAESVIIALELEVIGDEIVAGDEVRDGAACADPEIDVGRIDLADHTILIASLIRDNYTYAMDEALSQVELTLPRPPQLEGELRAYSFGFPTLEPVPLREEGGQLIVGPHDVEICDTIVIEEAGACQFEHAAQISERLPEAAATAQALLRYLHEKMYYVNRHLLDLDVDVPAARAAYNKAIALKQQSAQEFDQGQFARSFTTARAAQRSYRQMLYEYREYAEQFRKYAPEPMHLYLMMPYDLPKYFASFDHTTVRLSD